MGNPLLPENYPSQLWETRFFLTSGLPNPLESQNHPISVFPTPWKMKNTHFLRFQPLGKPKSLNFCVSNPLESQNHPFSAFPTPWKVKITQFSVLPTPWKSKNAPFSPLGHGRRVENPKNKLSAMAEEQNTGKTAFRPRPTSEKREKQAFGHGRKMKIRKNSLPPHFQGLSASLFLKKIQKKPIQ